MAKPPVSTTRKYNGSAQIRTIALPRRRPLRIALLAPLAEAVPPLQYGGTERVVAYLAEALVALGHEVTLFASGDSRAQVPVVACCPVSLRTAQRQGDPQVWAVLQFERLLELRERFDVVHFHNGHVHFALREWLPPHVTTLHGRVDNDPAEFYRNRRHGPLIAISEAQRATQPEGHWMRTVHHGLPRDLLTPGAGDGGYLAFLGRISPEKRVDRAIEIARDAGLPIRILAKIDQADTEYFEHRIRPLLDQPHVQFLGEGDERAKHDLLAHARALLFPIDWPEPFGLVMIEALACGTPVIAWREGSVPEVIEHGRTGFVVDSIADAVAAVKRVGAIDRGECRRVFEHRFDAQRMAEQYVEVYRTLIRRRQRARKGASPEAQAWQSQSN